MNGVPREPGAHQLPGAMREPVPTKFAPLSGLACGAMSGACYWLAVQLWPSSVALILSMLVGALMAKDLRFSSALQGVEALGLLFYTLLKYSVLLALSAAKLPFDAPPNTTLPLIMICGCGAARALLVCLAASRPVGKPAPLSYFDLSIALLLGFSPALLLGMPGLIGLAAAVASVIGLAAAPKGALKYAAWIAESCFYLGAQASWSFV